MPTLLRPSAEAPFVTAGRASRSEVEPIRHESLHASWCRPAASCGSRATRFRSCRTPPGGVFGDSGGQPAHEQPHSARRPIPPETRNARRLAGLSASKPRCLELARVGSTCFTVAGVPSPPRVWADPRSDIRDTADYGICASAGTLRRLAEHAHAPTMRKTASAAAISAIQFATEELPKPYEWSPIARMKFTPT